ncbi:AAA family ATPase [Reyranella sp.]|uniref:AAA family ATPase n=1 Tax=Reyranella sp. TaxID=1929291 RepID=UPI003783A51B
MNSTPDLAELEAATSRFAPLDGKVNGAGAHDGGLPLVMWGDIDKAVPPDKLVHGLLGEGRFAAFYGAPKSGKTFLVSHLCMCVALGWDFFGRRVSRGAVLYVAAEGADGLKNRILGARIKYEIPADTAVPFAVVPVAINLGPGGEDVAKVVAAAAELQRRTGHPVRIIVLDTLARVMPGADENSVADMGATLARADRIIKETGATVILVHHSGKAADAGPRGSTALPGALDTIVKVVKSDTGERTATVEAQRDGREGDAFSFRLEPVVIGVDDDGDDIMTAVLVPVDDSATAPKAKRRDPTGNTGVVFRALQRAIADSGEDAPASAHIPNGARVVSPDRWREYAYKMLSEATPETRQKAFKRGHDALISTGFVGVWGAYAWVI